jgi:glycosyltransferase involved in cell wall biosynthesis
MRIVVFYPGDLLGGKAGGIRSFVLDFIRFAPPDFSICVIGCTHDPEARPSGTVQAISVAGRQITYYPVLTHLDLSWRPRVPLTLKFAAAARLRTRALLHGRSVLQFHDLGTASFFYNHPSPKLYVCHVDPRNLVDGKGESRWRHVRRIVPLLESLVIPKMGEIYAVDRAAVAYYRERGLVQAGKSHFLPTSVDFDRFRPYMPTDRARCRRTLAQSIGVDPGALGKVALFVGRLEAQKDPELLLHAIHFARQREAVRLVVAGHGTMRPMLADTALRLGLGEAVHWLGMVRREDLPDLLNAADVFVMASRFEGMPIALLEALACGLPAVAPAVGEVGLVLRDRKNGRLLADRTAESIAAAIIWVLDQPRERFASAAVEAVRPYESRRVLQAFYEAHRRLAESDGGADGQG